MFSGHHRTHREIKWARQFSGASAVLLPSDDSFKSTKWLYRYVSLVQCIDLFENAHLTLSNPESWPDKYEGAWIHRLCGPDGPLKRARIRAACFTRDPWSESFWRIYGRVSPVIRLRFVFDELVVGLGDYSDDKAKTFLAPVRYVQTTQIEQTLEALVDVESRSKSAQAARFLLQKRAAFSHESEVRVLRITNKAVGNFHSIPIDVRLVVDQVVIDPYSEEWMETVIKNLIVQRYGFSGDVHRSTLDRFPELDR
jgi:hypothetical protein